VRGSAKTVQAEIVALARLEVGTVANEAGAQQRREARGRRPGRQRQAVAGVGQHLLRIAAVAAVAGEARLGTQILLSRAAVAAYAAGVGEPRYADAIAGGEALHLAAVLEHHADDLMS
jgi:hypothetical protein